jgi:hypothetical protein
LNFFSFSTVQRDHGKREELEEIELTGSVLGFLMNCLMSLMSLSIMLQVRQRLNVCGSRSSVLWMQSGQTIAIHRCLVAIHSFEAMRKEKGQKARVKRIFGYLECKK